MLYFSSLISLQSLLFPIKFFGNGPNVCKKHGPIVNYGKLLFEMVNGILM